MVEVILGSSAPSSAAATLDHAIVARAPDSALVVFLAGKIAPAAEDDIRLPIDYFAAFRAAK